MANTEYKFNPEWIKQETEKAQATLKEVTGRTDFVNTHAKSSKNGSKRTQSVIWLTVLTGGP